MTSSPAITAPPIHLGQPGGRKRTMSFSAPPRKAARTTLQRTGSYLSLTDMQAAVTTSLYGRGGTSSTSSSSPSSFAERASVMPQTRRSRHHKDERDRRKPPPRQSNTVTHTPAVVSPPPTPVAVAVRHSHSSPLAPQQVVHPTRTYFPRSKPQPDLYRVAITTRMRMSPEGRKILYMGPRLALSMCTANRELERSLHMATSELERIVNSQRETDCDVVMTEDVGQPWVVLPPEDWEMVDCAA